jgi:pimeloyl-ACP methyl ester carboxylesterase
LLYLVLCYLSGLSGWILWRLLTDTAPRMLAADQNKLRGTGVTFSETQDKGVYAVAHTIEDGIERVVYTPKVRQHETPILMAHGMWHGAWCWQPWQEILAEKGWESVAYSLPGHGKSPLQRSLTQCTLGYYLAFARDEINRLPRKPVLMGHSMGGALGQWALRYLGDDFPAVVLVAPWVSHGSFLDTPSALNIITSDPIGVAMMFYQFNADSWVRTPEMAAAKLLSKEAVVSPGELKRQLVGESSLVIFQHEPPFWKPVENVKTPMLVLAGEKDAVVSVDGLRKTAAHYKADLRIIPGAAHNLMMEKSYRETAESIDRWLCEKQIAWVDEKLAE